MTGMPFDADESGPHRPRMTMRVYRVSPDGLATEIRGRVEVMADENLSPVTTNQFPPCCCPRHRGGDGGAVRP